MKAETKYCVNEEVFTLVNGETVKDRISHISVESGLVKDGEADIIKDRTIYTIGKSNPPTRREEHYVWKTEEELIEASEEKIIRLPKPEKKEVELKVSKCESKESCECK